MSRRGAPFQALEPNERWIPLLEYAIKKGVSLSTLRRYIKAGKIQHRLENGRYLVLDQPGNPYDGGYSERRPDESALLQSLLGKAETDLQKAKEEIAELKTLIAFYEERLPQGKLDV